MLWNFVENFTMVLIISMIGGSLCCWWFACINWFRVGSTPGRDLMATELETQGYDPGHDSALRRIRYSPEINICSLSDQKACSDDGVNFWKPPNVYSRIVL